ncbi:MAG: hypothetical protein WBA23_21985, partial [Tunicatimonas sp.]|uniref:hypothetical protein n=1 Tax=Tunicatimonas sp. TaxID=1940096 RepID=UPI003C751C00
PQAKKSDKQQIQSKLSEEDSLRIVKDRYWSNRGVTTRYTDATGNKIVRTYDEATEEEKARFPSPPSLSFITEKAPSHNQLNDWLDSEVYGVWVDGQRIDNASLAEYQSIDFSYFGVSKLAKNAKNYGKHDFQVNLQTLKQFEKHQEEYFERLGIDPKTMKLIL